MSIAKTNLIQQVTRAGWETKYIDSLQRFYECLEAHEIRYEPDRETCLIQYQAEVRREWHDALDPSSPAPTFDIGIINEDRIARTMRTILNRGKPPLYIDSERSRNDKPPSHAGYAPTNDEYDPASSSEDSVNSRSTSPEYNELISPTIGSPSASPENDDHGLSLVCDSSLPEVDSENDDIAQTLSQNHELPENRPTRPGSYSGSPSPTTPSPHHKTASRRRRRSSTPSTCSDDDFHQREAKRAREYSSPQSD